LEIEVNIQDLFTHPVLQDFAAAISIKRKMTISPSIIPGNRPEHIPLSFSQQRLWFIDQLQGSLNYQFPLVLKLIGTIDTIALEKALIKIISRHEILRTIIKEYNSIPYQEILSADAWNLTFSILQSNDKAPIDNLIRQEVSRPFDLATDFMFRAHLIRISSTEHILIVVIHHIVSDGWSMSVFTDELVELYQSAKEGRSARLTELPVQYADYAIWQRNYLSGEVLDKKLAYWVNNLKGAEPLNLPLDYARPAMQSDKGQTVSYQIDKMVSDKLSDLSKKEGVTIFMTLLAAFKVLLYKYSGQEDICVGTTIANRTQAEIESLIGFFANTLVLRSDLRNNPGFKELLAQVKKITLAAYDHQDVPFENIVDKLVDERDMSRNPIFDVLFTLHNNPPGKSIDLGDVTFSLEAIDTLTCQFDINFNITESPDGLYLGVEYCRDLFREETIRRFIQHYETLLSSIVKNPAQRIDEISMLPAEEKEIILGKKPMGDSEWCNQGIKDLSNNLPINLRFEEIVAKNKKAVAVIHQGAEWNYESINNMSNQVAHVIQDLKIQPGDCVGVYLDRGAVLISCLLGSLKAGAVYTPLDTQNPPDRIKKMISGNKISVVISTAELIMNLNKTDIARILLVDECSNELKLWCGANRVQIMDKSDISKSSKENLPNCNKMESWAYVLFTSGSTGEPKGAIIHHEGAMNHILAEYEALDLPDGFRFLQSANIGSDVSVWQMLGPLLKGGAVVIIDKDDLLDYNSLTIALKENKINVVEFVPTYSWGMVDYIQGLQEVPLFKDLSWIMLTGEKVPVDLANKLKKLFPGTRILNCYGPCEASDDVVQYEIKEFFPQEQIHVPIGRPIANMNVFVLDKSGSLCPIGVAGELCVSGTGVGLGYLGMPEKTALSFISNPFHGTVGSTIYKTGDLGKWLPEGNLVFLGRSDNQVKIRGHRVEPGEIESFLRKEPGVKDCYVMIHKDGQGQEFLIAFVVPDSKVNNNDTLQNDITSVCRNGLPSFMQPTNFCIIDEMPLNVSHKIDEKKLLQLFDKVIILNDKGFVAPRNEIEKSLSDIWKKILNVESISVYDNFFEIGGHSLLATKVMTTIRKELEIEIAIGDLFRKPSINELSSHIGTKKKAGSLPLITIQKRPPFIPLSYSQERLWFIDKLQGSINYHIPSVVRLHGHLNNGLLEQAFKGIVDRHEALRTVFKEEEGIAYQEILSSDAWRLEFTVLSDDEKLINDFIASELNKPFDLSADFMLRVHVARLSEVEHILVFVMHHIASDGWSSSILVKELIELHQALKEGRQSNLTPLPVQYADYALWQKNHLDKVIDKKLAYWENKLKDVEPLNLPTDFKRPLIQSTRGDYMSFTIDKTFTRRLYELSKQEGVTLFVTLLSAFKVLLYRYTGQDDICVGTPVANRTQKEIEPLIGCFINTLAIRTHIENNLGFKELLLKIKETTLEAYNHQEAPLEKIIDRVERNRDMSRSPLFQVLFTLDNNEMVDAVDIGDIILSGVPFKPDTTKFDLSFNISELPGGLNVGITYCSDLFLENTIARLADHYLMLLQSVVGDVTKKVGKLQMLTDVETKQLVQEFNSSNVIYPGNETIADLFEKQVVKTPGRTALVLGEEKLTYSELNERSNQLARHLCNKGVKKNWLVGICLNNPLEMVVGIMGVLKSGGAYVPIDPDLPIGRLDYIIKHTGIAFIITDKQCKNLFETGDPLVAVIDIRLKTIKTEGTQNLHLKRSAEDASYVIFTSGSTGRPKGVIVTNGNLVDYFYGLFSATEITRSNTFALMSTLTADLGNTILFGSLLSGGILHLFSPDTLKDPNVLHNYFTQHGIDCIKIVPSHWKALDIGVPLLPRKIIIFGGEELSSEILERIKSVNHVIEIINHYGPTETTIGKLIYKVDKAKSYQYVPIGVPFSNSQAYILDAGKELCAVGIPGELFISGDGVAAGYLNEPALTSEKFVEDSFAKGKRMYSTGDIVRRLSDGNIVFLGRTDNQVKIRGYRVELGEIETVLEELSMIRQAVLIPQKDNENNSYLIAYIVSAQPFDREAVILYLKNRLPDYMMPSLFIELKELPLTSNGKIDRKRLPAPEASIINAHEYVAPRNEMERKLTDIWKELLKVVQVGVYDNFFESGGHSLLAVRVISAIRKDLGKELPIQQLFFRPTISELALYLDSKEESNPLPRLVPVSRPAQIPLSFSQKRLWFIDRLHGSLSYHIPIVLRLNGPIDENALAEAFKKVIIRHEILRTVIEETDGVPYQKILTPDNWVLSFSVVESDHDIAGMVLQEVKKSFDLSKDYMLRAHLIGMSEMDHILIIVMHHIVSDGWSRSIFIDELVELYQSMKEGRSAKLPVLAIQYADYAIWQRNYLAGDVLNERMAYWVNNLKGVEPLNLPVDYARPAIQSNNGAFFRYELDKTLSDKIYDLSAREGTTLFMTLLAAFDILLYRYTGQEDICVGATIANRTQKEIEPLIGFFANALALRSNLKNNPRFKELLAQVKDTTLAAYTYQDVPFENIVDDVTEGRDMSRNPLFDVLFTLQNNPVNKTIDLGELILSQEPLETGTTQFDINFNVTETVNGLVIGVEYCTDLFSRDTIARLPVHFEQLLHSIVKDPLNNINALNILTPDEKKQLLKTFNHTEISYPQDKTVIDLFVEQACRTPDDIAILFGDTKLTYQELNEKSTQLACYLVDTYQIGQDDLVGIMMDRSDWAIISILGILKSGGAYVPIDPEYPPERKSFIINDTGLKVLIIQCESLFDLEKFNVNVFSIDLQLPGINNQKYENIKLSGRGKPGGLAYVIYTSGSTGNPKGVMIENRSLMNYLLFAISHYSENIRSFSFPLFTSLSFDLTQTSIFLTLLTGGRLLIEKSNDASLVFENILNDSEINSVKLTPSHVNFIGDINSSSLSVAIVGGEKLDSTHIQKLTALNPGLKIFNEYGPTESTIGCTVSVINRNDSLISIGKPISNTQIYILDVNRELLPIGIPGEIYIGGEGLARGYLNRADLAREKFIPNPFSSDPEATLYRTGDKARWLPDGNIEYLERLDDQVKIRGYRIELGEIESVLQRSGQIKQCVVLAKEEQSGNRRLIAYVVTANGYDRSEIQAHMRRYLPEYMVPASIMELELFPLTSNGKIDKKLLPDPDASALPLNEYAAPRNETEEKLTTIWKEVLNVDRVGINDDFFKLGGHSLLIVKLGSLIRHEFSLNLPITTLFKYPTISALSNYIDVIGSVKRSPDENFISIDI
jgi:amino acid adenylation domain-containing protein